MILSIWVIIGPIDIVDVVVSKRWTLVLLSKIGLPIKSLIHSRK